MGASAASAASEEEEEKTKEEEEEGEEGVAPLLKSRDPHLAGGEQLLYI